MRNIFYQKHFAQKGFTLIELAIVLVIVALITGGILTGKSMLTSSKLRNVAIYANQYITAIDDFHQKYDAFPGDMPNATAIWGRADGGAPISSNCATPATDIDAADSDATCNGDGDQTIGRVAGQTYEIFRAWQHLKSAGFISGEFTGIAGGAGASQSLVGVNVPKGEIGQSGYDISYLDDAALPAGYFTGLSYRHVVHYGLQVAGNNLARGAAISAADASNIDAKVDDGKPATGKLVTFNNTVQTSCASTDVPATADYQRTNSSANDCTLVFITGY
jgi:prepilin-type N-terminal cleavage/methylation domain-containing protein